VLFQSLGRDSVHSSIPPCAQQPSRQLRFNPSVGILFIQASSGGIAPPGLNSFQSLGRDSVHSSSMLATLAGYEDTRFNPSVGILFIQATVLTGGPGTGKTFQSLGRDSVHSSESVLAHWTEHWKFQSLGRDSVHSSLRQAMKYRAQYLVSIPRSGFCSFKHRPRDLQRDEEGRFNPSVGILFIQARLTKMEVGSV